MSEEIEVTIKIPAPPEGWGNVRYGYASPGDMMLVRATGCWAECQVTTTAKYIVASKLPEPWTPPPQWHAFFGDCWLTMDQLGDLELYATKPELLEHDGIWEGEIVSLVEFLRNDLKPPDDIPWTKCCWKIGNPKE